MATKISYISTHLLHYIVSKMNGVSRTRLTRTMASMTSGWRRKPWSPLPADEGVPEAAELLSSSVALQNKIHLEPMYPDVPSSPNAANVWSHRGSDPSYFFSKMAFTIEYVGASLGPTTGQLHLTHCHRWRRLLLRRRLSRKSTFHRQRRQWLS